MTKFYQYFADTILFLHFSFVFFIIVSLILILLGGYLKWVWIRNWWFRVVHLAGISFVVVQSWLGLICPLTTLEMWLREQVSEAHYTGSFIQYWLQRILYYQASDWVFILIYSLFGLLVIVSWVRFPPHKRVMNS